MNVKIISHTVIPEIIGGVAARCCTSENIPDVNVMGTEIAKDRKAFKNAMDSGHHSVAEHITFTFAIEGISRACSHQLVRHRMASYSQQSQRYVKMDGFEYVKPPSIPDDKLFNGEDNARIFANIMYELECTYKSMIEAGIPEEDARYILPNACCTNIVMTVNLRELIHIAELRLCTRAQWEIRELAEKMVECVENIHGHGDVLAQYLVPQCQKLGYCPEKKGCGRYPPKVY